MAILEHPLGEKLAEVTEPHEPYLELVLRPQFVGLLGFEVERLGGIDSPNIDRMSGRGAGAGAGDAGSQISAIIHDCVADDSWFEDPRVCEGF